MNVIHQLLLKLVNTVSPRNSLMPVFTEHKKQHQSPVKNAHNTHESLACDNKPKPSEIEIAISHDLRKNEVKNSDTKNKESNNKKANNSEVEKPPQLIKPTIKQSIKPKVSFETIGIMYNIPNSPYQHALQQMVYNIYCQYSDQYNVLPIEIENALYFGVKRYLCGRQYNQNNEHYLQGLLADIEQGKRHHNDACYYHRDAENVFRSIKYTVIGLLQQACNSTTE